MRKKLVGQPIEAYLGAVSRHSPGGVLCCCVVLHRTRACMLRTFWLASLGHELDLAIRCDSPKRVRKDCVHIYCCFALLCRAAAGLMRSLLCACNVVVDMTRPSHQRPPLPPNHASLIREIRRIELLARMDVRGLAEGVLGLAPPSEALCWE